MRSPDDIVNVPDNGQQPKTGYVASEDGIEIPIDQLQQETLRNVISEFVTREWEELGDAGRYTLGDKIDQVLAQLRDGRAKLVYDQVSMSCKCHLGNNVMVKRRPQSGPPVGPSA